MPSKFVFIKSAVEPKDFPQANRLEVAIAGRSNAGKSSLLNALSGTKIAKVSQQPGKTRLLNFFDVGENYRVVDMPGYGFASRSGDEMREWNKMIENYLSLRGVLTCIILVMDIRRNWSEDEEILKKFLNKINIPMVLVLSKIDKLSRNELASRKLEITKQSRVEDVFLISSESKQGVEDMEDQVFVKYIKPKLKDFKP